MVCCLGLVGCPKEGSLVETDGGVDAAPDSARDAFGLRDTQAPDVPVDGGRDTYQTDAHEPDATAWRSALYPADWQPGDADEAGRFLHDFSYAGYHHGEGTPDRPTVRVDVTDWGADPTGGMDATEAIQSAIDAAVAMAEADGVVIAFPAGTFRIDGLLTVTQDGLLLQGAGSGHTRLRFTRVRGMSDRSNLTFGAPPTHGSEIPLRTDGALHDRAVRVDDAAGLAVGDDIAIGWHITDAFVAEHGMEGTWRVFNGQWQPFFRRTVRRIEEDDEGAIVHFAVPLRYAARLRDGASIRKESGVLHEVGLEAMSLTNATTADEAWAETRVHVVAFEGVADGWVDDVHSYAPDLEDAEARGAHLASGGLLVRASKRVSVRNASMGEAIHRGGGGNGYLFEVRASSEILFADNVAQGGRHGFIQNWGFGTSGCVWLRVRSEGGRALTGRGGFGLVGLSDFHHSLAMANLIDASELNDGWSAGNRGRESSGAGHSATQNVFWNTRGTGVVASSQYGWGYVIGTHPMLRVTPVPWLMADTEPGDYVEGMGDGAALEPASLYEDQLARRVVAE